MRSNFGYTKNFKRIDQPGHAHELTFSCFKKQPFFKSERACSWLAEAITNARTKHGFHLWAYVFMPDHVHLLIFVLEDQPSVSDIAKSMKKSVSRRALIHVRKNDPSALKRFATGFKRHPYAFWQRGPGYDRNMTTPVAVHASMDYIHNNPVKAGLCRYTDAWRWSSAADWQGTGTSPISLDREFVPRKP